MPDVIDTNDATTRFAESPHTLHHCRSAALEKKSAAVGAFPGAARDQATPYETVGSTTIAGQAAELGVTWTSLHCSKNALLYLLFIDLLQNGVQAGEASHSHVSCSCTAPWWASVQLWLVPAQWISWL
jgi:hypothetical protein